MAYRETPDRNMPSRARAFAAIRRPEREAFLNARRRR